MLIKDLLAQRLETIQCALSLLGKSLCGLLHQRLVFTCILHCLVGFTDNITEWSEKKVKDLFHIAFRGHNRRLSALNGWIETQKRGLAQFVASEVGLLFVAIAAIELEPETAPINVSKYSATTLTSHDAPDGKEDTSGVY